MFVIISVIVLVSLRSLLEKSSGERFGFSVTVSELAVTVRYSQPGRSAPRDARFRTEGRIGPRRWTHLALQVIHQGFGEPLKDRFEGHRQNESQLNVVSLHKLHHWPVS